MSKVRLNRLLARWVVVLALAAPVTPLGIGRPVPALSAAAPLGATISVLALPVEVATTDPGALFAPAIDGQTLFEGDTVRTGPGGMALVTFFDGSESQLGGESQVQIEQVTANPAPQIAFLQTAGVTVNHVIPMPAEGSFRTDTPAATGLVRGTSYIVIVGSAGTCGAAGDQPCAASSMILLTDRNGHVGRVDVTANGSSVAAVQLATAGDAATASNSIATAAHTEPAALAHLESVAHVRDDPTASHTTEQDARAIAAALLPVAAVAPATPADTVPVPQPNTRAATGAGPGSTTSDTRPPATPEQATAPIPPAAQTGDRSDRGGHGNAGVADVTAPAAPASTAPGQSPPAPAASPPKVAASAKVTTTSHVDNRSASTGNNSAKSASSTSPVPPSTPSTSGDSGKSDKSTKSATAASSSSSANSVNAGNAGNSNH